MNRIIGLDIARGILIILVVLGHANPPFVQYIFWFHMPAFFILSGMLFKPENIVKLLKKNAKALLLPYLANFGLLTLAGLLVQQVPLQQVLSNFLDLLRGGTYLKDIYGVFWFITALFLSRIIFGVIETKVKSIYLRIGLYGLFYLLAHMLSSGSRPTSEIWDFWWSPRYYLLGVPYLALGYYGRQFFLAVYERRLSILPVLALSAIIVAMERVGWFSYQFDWKFGYTNSLVGDLVIPIIGFLLVLTIARLFDGNWGGKILSYLGTKSQTIMYWHILVVDTIGQYFYLDSLSFTMLGTILPLATLYLPVNFRLGV